MKTKLLRALSLLLVLSMFLFACACGKKETSSDPEYDDDYETLEDLDAEGEEGEEGGEEGGSTSKGGGTSKGGSTSTATSGSKATGNKLLDSIPAKLKGTVVTVAAWGDENAVQYKKVADYFAKKSKIQIKWVTYEETKYIQKIVEQNAAGSGPDVVICNVTFPSALEAVQELPAIFDINDGFWDPRVTESLSAKGKNFFVNSYNSPIAQGGTFMFYNKDIFANNNIKSPQNYVDEGTWTWENVEKALRDCKQAGYDGGTILPHIIWSTTGAQLVPYDSKTSTYSNGLNNASYKSDILYSLKLIAKLRTEHIIANESLTRFASGTMAMAVTNNFGMKYNGWFKGMSPSQLGVVNMPKTMNGRASNYLNNCQRGYGIGKKAKNIEGAYYFLRFFLDYDNFAETGASIFLNKNMEKFFMNDYRKSLKSNPMCCEYMTKPLELAGYPWSSASAGSWTEVTGQKTPEEVENLLMARSNIIDLAAQKANEKLNAVLK